MVQRTPLPPTLEMLHGIFRNDDRLELIALVESIRTKMRLDTLPHETERSYTKVTDFYAYLIQSCASKEQLNRRVKWLIIYAKAIQDHLRLRLIRHTGLSTAPRRTVDPNNEMSAYLDKLAGILIEYQFTENKVTGNHKEARYLKVAGALLDCIPRIEPHPKPEYHNILTVVKFLCDEYEVYTTNRLDVILSRSIYLDLQLHILQRRIERYLRETLYP